MQNAWFKTITVRFALDAGSAISLVLVRTARDTRVNATL